MQREIRRALALLSLGVGGALTLAACGGTGTPAASQHVVPTTTASSTVPTTTVPTGSSASASGSTGTDPLDAPAATAAFNQLQGELSSVDSNLAQVSSDLDNPQGDS